MNGKLIVDIQDHRPPNWSTISITPPLVASEAPKHSYKSVEEVYAVARLNQLERLKSAGVLNAEEVLGWVLRNVGGL